MYDEKFIRWYKVTDELKRHYAAKLESARSTEAKYKIENDFRKYKADLEKKRKLSINLQEIRNEILYKHQNQKGTFSNMIKNEKDIHGLPVFPLGNGVPKANSSISDKLVYTMETPVRKRIDEATQPNIKNEREAAAAEFDDQMNQKYFDQKFQWYKHSLENAISPKERYLEELAESEQTKENNMEEKLEFMYNHLDHHNDRKKVRKILAHEIHKKASIQDIGEMLDEIIIQYQAQYPEAKELNPKALTEDVTSEDLFFGVQDEKYKNTIYPSLYENRDRIRYEKNEQLMPVYDEIIRKVDTEDQDRDHSKQNLSENEKLELQIFSTIKKDPYFKHYIYNCLRYEADYVNANINDNALAIAADNYKMRLRFDPISIPVLDGGIKVNKFEERLINGKAWGAGRRKSARSIACVYPGSGKITVNGKPLLDYFKLPFQRSMLVQTVRYANYTSVLDIDVWVKGGGYMGQSKACVPAVAKAIARFDPSLREHLDECRVIRSDGRVKERKKYGLKRARKGRVYKRR